MSEDGWNRPKHILLASEVHGTLPSCKPKHDAQRSLKGWNSFSKGLAPFAVVNVYRIRHIPNVSQGEAKVPLFAQIPVFCCGKLTVRRTAHSSLRRSTYLFPNVSNNCGPPLFQSSDGVRPEAANGQKRPRNSFSRGQRLAVEASIVWRFFHSYPFLPRDLQNFPRLEPWDYRITLFQPCAPILFRNFHDTLFSSRPVQEANGQKILTRDNLILLLWRGPYRINFSARELKHKPFLS